MEPITVGAGPQGAPAGADREQRRRIDGHHPAPRHESLDAHRRDRGRPLLAREVRAWFDTGAYADNGPRVVATGADAAPGPYRWEAVKVDAWGVYTNTSPAGSYRAFGATHLQWCGEAQIDEIGRRCGLDARADARAESAAAGRICPPRRQTARRRSHRRHPQIAPTISTGTRPNRRNVGRGMSVGLLAAGAHPVSTAFARMEADGEVVLYV